MSIRRAHTTRTSSAIAISAVLALALVGCSGDADDDASSPESVQSSAAGDTTDSDEDTSSPADDSENADSTKVDEMDLATHTFDLRWSDALDRARGEFGGDISKIELEVEDNVYAYKVELMSDEQKFEYQIDANTGDVLEQETEDFSSDKVKTERKAKAIDITKVVDLEHAMETALAEQDGRVTEWKLEGTSSGPVYEFDIVKNGSTDDVEVKIDALSGDVLPSDD